MTKKDRKRRDKFAGQAMQALVSTWGSHRNKKVVETDQHIIAKLAWDQADAMLAHDKQGKTGA